MSRTRRRPFFPWNKLHPIQLCALQGFQVGGFTGNRAIPFNPVPKKKALLIGINYRASAQRSTKVLNQESKNPRGDVEEIYPACTSESVEVPYEELNAPQKDVEEMCSLLIGTYGYKQEDIVILSDKDGVAENLVPTFANITTQLHAFLNDQNPGDQYVFLFAGHTSQIESADLSERDGRDEQIVTSDGKTILDDLLNEYLVRPLKRHSRLTAIFDSCHSGTLLDLPHDKCNRMYGLTSRKRRLMRRLLEPVLKKLTLNIDGNLNNTPILYGIHEYIIKHFFNGGHCDGYCPRLGTSPSSPTIICISACKDDQMAYETEEGYSVTQIIVDTLRKDPHPTFKKLMHSINVGSQALDARIVQDVIQFNMKDNKYKKSIGRPINSNDPGQIVSKYRRNPQFSSISPLRMASIFNL